MPPDSDRAYIILVQVFLHFPSEMRKKTPGFEKKSLDSFLLWYTINMCRIN